LEANETLKALIETDNTWTCRHFLEGAETLGYNKRREMINK
jgi:hypothetical protein